MTKPSGLRSGPLALHSDNTFPPPSAHLDVHPDTPLFFCDRFENGMQNALFRAPPNHPWLLGSIEVIKKYAKDRSYMKGPAGPHMLGPAALGVASKIRGICQFFAEESLDLDGGWKRPRIGYFVNMEGQMNGNGFSLSKHGAKSVVQSAEPLAVMATPTLEPDKSKPLTPTGGLSEQPPPPESDHSSDQDSDQDWLANPRYNGTIPFLVYKFTYLTHVIPEVERGFYPENSYATLYHERKAWRTEEEVRERQRRFPISSSRE